MAKTYSTRNIFYTLYCLLFFISPLQASRPSQAELQALSCARNKSSSSSAALSRSALMPLIESRGTQLPPVDLWDSIILPYMGHDEGVLATVHKSAQDNATILKGHTHWINSAHFNHDSSKIVTASFDKTARIWDSTTGQSLQKLIGHSNWVKSAQFNHDGSKIVTASWDKTARIWDSTTGQSLHELTGHSHWIISAQFNHDGTQIVTASQDNTIRTWNTNTGLETPALRQRIGVKPAIPNNRNRTGIQHLQILEYNAKTWHTPCVHPTLNQWLLLTLLEQKREHDPSTSMNLKNIAQSYRQSPEIVQQVFETFNERDQELIKKTFNIQKHSAQNKGRSCCNIQ